MLGWFMLDLLYFLNSPINPFSNSVIGLSDTNELETVGNWDL